MHVDLKDHSLFAANRHLPVLDWLRKNAPVHWHEDPAGGGFWVLTRHRDVTRVYADHETFSSRHGMRLDSDPDAVKAVSQRMLIVSDPPTHTALKKAVGASFGPAELPRLELLVRQVVREVLDDALVDGRVDLVDVVKTIPNHVVCAIMGLPRSDWAWIGEITTGAFESGDESERAGAHAEIFLYFSEILARRRADPGDDFISRVACGQSGSRALSDEEVVFNCNGVLAGANETTRHSAAGAVLAFIEHPDQWNRLREGGPAAIPAAVEEILRWTTPGVHALRTATRDTSVGGVRIQAGDQVTVWNAAANHDDEVFPEPGRFDIARTPNRHVTFGHGRHVCVGARLARLELAVYLEELIGRVAAVEGCGAPVFTASNFTWGLLSLPVDVRLAARPGP
ncbi:cytochrome P450 [Kibdelosporangium persicum]|uniref:Linalool 8-monooxygenase n=1 Tax=Kibdelosporangium persicum TaxID=2698649 RepID=A0ABX2FH22_9PSEU|nr:cytochrome P450 [Kibdelosporangium persicum]NRN70677.1 Linalool 8-monooxygenase [Kibdelosporangium persicum]